MEALGFRVAAPAAAQRTALEKNNGANAGAVMNAVVLDIENGSTCRAVHRRFPCARTAARAVRAFRPVLHLLYGRVLRTRYEIILQIRTEIHKIGAVARHPDNQVAV